LIKMDYVYHRLFCRFDENVLHLLQITWLRSCPPPNHCWIYISVIIVHFKIAPVGEPLVPLGFYGTKLSPHAKKSFPTLNNFCMASGNFTMHRRNIYSTFSKSSIFDNAVLPPPSRRSQRSSWNLAWPSTALILDNLILKILYVCVELFFHLNLLCRSYFIKKFQKKMFYFDWICS
jgi:hypothetical protein